MASSAIRDRRELTSVLESAMANAYEELSESQRLLFGHNLVKTYLLERDVGLDDRPWWASLQSDAVRIEPTTDPNLVSAIVSSRGGTARSREPVALVFDRIDERFLLCHSLAEATRSDNLIEAFTSGPELDNFWLPSEMLESLSRLGALRGFGTRFDRSRFRTSDGEEFQEDAALIDELLPVESLKLKLWGSESLAALEALRQTRTLRRAVSVSSVRIRYVAVGARDLFSLDELSFSGRITTRGTSYDVHREFVSRVVDVYGSRLRELEHQHRIRVSERHLLGQPAVIELDPPIAPAIFAKVVFSGAGPFRLFGLVQELGRDYLVVPAVDMHGGHRVDIEVTPTFLRIYLRGSACANTLLRLETTLQHAFNAEAIVSQ